MFTKSPRYSFNGGLGPIAVCTNNMGKLAFLRGTDALLCEVRALANMLMFAVEPLLAVTKDSEIAADAFAAPHLDMGVWAFSPRTSSCIGKVNTEGCALRSGVVREWAS